MVQVSGLTFNRQKGNISLSIIRDFNAVIRQGEFVSIVGPSGCGKSTVIGLLSGSLAPTSGKVKFSSGKPRLGVQFQTDALFPWRRVWSNLGYPLEIARQSKKARRSHAAMLCELVELDPATFLDRYPSELSGGERRRVSLAMAISASPQFLLIDEATGNLDWLTRRSMQKMLQKLCAERNLTTVAVTHDVEEAVWLSDRVLVMENGGKTEEFSIDIPRFRDASTRENPIFIHTVARIAAHLSESQMREVPK